MDSPDEVNPELQSKYRGIVGFLMYLYQWTRPDLGFAVTFCQDIFINLVTNIFKLLNMYCAI
jgi:hypothetical protein